MAISTRTESSERGDGRPDACGHVSRFDRGFNGCPAFEAVEFEPKTFQGQPLKKAVACRFLTVEGEVDRGPFYPRCALGGPDARRAYATARGRAEAEWGQAG